MNFEASLYRRNEIMVPKNTLWKRMGHSWCRSFVRRNVGVDCQPPPCLDCINIGTGYCVYGASAFVGSLFLCLSDEVRNQFENRYSTPYYTKPEFISTKHSFEYFRQCAFLFGHKIGYLLRKPLITNLYWNRIVHTSREQFLYFLVLWGDNSQTICTHSLWYHT